jgi:hypothetical protein
MIVYSFDPTDMQFTGAADAFESPLEPGVFLHPANSTEVQPPDFDSATQVCEFNGTAWVVRVRTEAALPPSPTPEEVRDAQAADLLKGRALLLADSDWMVIRHQDELLSGVEPTLTPDKLKVVLAYRQELRNIPEAADFPECGLPALVWAASP